MGPADKNPKNQYNQQQFYPVRSVKKGKKPNGTKREKQKTSSFAKERKRGSNVLPLNSFYLLPRQLDIIVL